MQLRIIAQKSVGVVVRARQLDKYLVAAAVDVHSGRAGFVVRLDGEDRWHLAQRIDFLLGREFMVMADGQRVPFADAESKFRVVRVSGLAETYAAMIPVKSARYWQTGRVRVGRNGFDSR
jgi:hypothetical protein